MEQNSNRPIVRGGFSFFLIYAIHFILHIIFASKDYDTGFTIIVISITLMTFLVGPIIIILGRVDDEKVLANRLGAIISIFLSFGLGWAYAGMDMDLSIIFWPVGVILSHSLIEIFFLGQHHDFK